MVRGAVRQQVEARRGLRRLRSTRPLASRRRARSRYLTRSRLAVPQSQDHLSTASSATRAGGSGSHIIRAAGLPRA